MVTGIESFREWFKGNKEQYTIIGGNLVYTAITQAKERVCIIGGKGDAYEQST